MPIDHDPDDRRPRKRTTPQPAPLFDTVAPAATALDYTAPHQYEPAKDIRTPDQIAKLAAITNFTTGEPTAKLKRLPIPTNEELNRYNRPK